MVEIEMHQTRFETLENKNVHQTLPMLVFTMFIAIINNNEKMKLKKALIWAYTHTPLTTHRIKLKEENKFQSTTTTQKLLYFYQKKVVIKQQ